MKVDGRVAAPSLIVLLLLGGPVAAQEARDWLDRMSRAVEELNYRGRFVHVLGGTTEMLEIVHRNADGESGERILSLDGAGREFVRQGARAQAIFPDRRIVLYETRSDSSPLVSALPSNTAQFEPHYELALGGSARVADRTAQILEIKPLDEFRYGYKLWLDQETAMPLRSQLVGERGEIVEQIVFTEIEIADDVPASELEPTIDTSGFQALRAPAATPLAAEVPWRAMDVPGGFRLSAATQSAMAGSDTPVEHLVYSDGLATVSVFIEASSAQADMPDGFSTAGSTNAYSQTLGGHKVTAIGEVPRRTVRRIAMSLVAE
jgi:sigma-E factor negative regulatory protein RseB